MEISKLLLLAFFLPIFTSTKIVLPPAITEQPAAALIFIQATNFSSEQYIPLLKNVQTFSTSFSLWIGISDFSANIPDPLTLSSEISNIVSQMKSQGMPNPTKTFYVGHGLGGTILSNYFKNVQTDGIVLLGSFLPKSFREILQPEGKTQINFSSKTLTIGNELDGLCRVMRIAEAYYHSVENIVTQDSGKHLVMVVKGASHMQFASGDVPTFVRSNDLKPEITEEEAHSRIAQIIAAFMQEKSEVLQQKIEESQEFFKPLLDALKIEGSYHLKDPCYDDSTVNRNVEYCGHGSPWVNQAHNYMSGFETYENMSYVKLNADDNFHKVWTVVPDPLPACSNNCTFGKECELSCVSITELAYNYYDNLDTGFYPISADEMKTKMNSRESLLTYAGLKNVNFTQTDVWSVCKFINDKAIEWAFDNAGAGSLKRFSEIGEKYQTVEDYEALNGGLWIVDYLSYKEVQKDGDFVVEIQSCTSRYPLDYWLPLSSGFHFCKLLSPARVMEWIYLDGLKKKGSLN